jgi:hypothetical protein
VGEYDSTKQICLKGGLGTFASGILRYFTNKEKAFDVSLAKLAGSKSERDYILYWFLADLPSLLTNERQKSRFIFWIAKSIRNNEVFAEKRLVNLIRSFPLELQQSFADEFKDITNKKYPATRLSDGAPFLSAIDDYLFLPEEPPDEWVEENTIESEYEDDDPIELPPPLDWIMRPPEGWDEETSSHEEEIPF